MPASGPDRNIEGLKTIVTNQMVLNSVIFESMTVGVLKDGTGADFNLNATLSAIVRLVIKIYFEHSYNVDWFLLVQNYSSETIYLYIYIYIYIYIYLYLYLYLYIYLSIYIYLYIYLYVYKPLDHSCLYLN